MDSVYTRIENAVATVHAGRNSMRRVELQSRVRGFIGGVKSSILFEAAGGFKDDGEDAGFVAGKLQCNVAAEGDVGWYHASVR